MMEWIEIFLLVSTLLFGFYCWSAWTLNFWRARKVAGPSPLPLIGNMKDVLTGRSSLGSLLETIYNEYREEAAIGLFLRHEPVLLLTDLDLIEDVLIRDFATFTDRGSRPSMRVEPLTEHLVNLEPARWRPLRKRLTPAFTSGKLKEMFYLLLECGEQLEKYLDELSVTNEVVDCCELTAKFTTDVIGTCAFGIRMNALVDEDSEFRNMGRKIFSSDWRNFVRLRLRDSAPFIYSIVGRFFYDSDITRFFTNIMRETMEHRKKHGIVRHDFIDLIMELRDHPDKIPEIELTETLLTSQLFVFFLAGFETSSTAMSHALYELAQHQSIQDKLRSEIKDELARNDGQLTYEIIKSMKYLDMVFKETLRKYPPATILARKSGGKYTFAGTKVTIPEGIRVLVPVFAIHRDPKVFPNPEVFDPERFTEEAISARHPMSWLPFGDGPRNCIGARFANYQSKIGLIKILQHHRVEVCDKTQIPYVVNPRSVFLATTKGINVKISRVR